MMNHDEPFRTIDIWWYLSLPLKCSDKPWQTHSNWRWCSIKGHTKKRVSMLFWGDFLPMSRPVQSESLWVMSSTVPWQWETCMFASTNQSATAWLCGRTWHRWNRLGLLPTESSESSLPTPCPWDWMCSTSPDVWDLGQCWTAEWTEVTVSIFCHMKPNYNYWNWLLTLTRTYQVCNTHSRSRLKSSLPHQLPYKHIVQKGES